jgi:hypothetical protein
MRKNLVSVGSITDTGLIVKFFDHHFWILDKFNQTHAVASGVRDPSNGLYRFNESFEGNSLEYKDRVTLWHKRYGYLSYFGLDHLSKYNKVSGKLIHIIKYVKVVLQEDNIEKDSFANLITEQQWQDKKFIRT